jgi:hypothetical protein
VAPVARIEALIGNVNLVNNVSVRDEKGPEILTIDTKHPPARQRLH